jgi:hypothetical protein
MRLLRRAAHRVAVAVAHPVTDVDEVEVRVDLDDVDRAVVLEGADAGDVDRMVAADHHRQRSRGEDRADPGLDVGVACFVSVCTMSASPISAMRTPSR